MADNKQSAFQAGEAAGRAEEKSNVLMEKAKDSASAAQESATQNGEKISETAAGAANLVKEKTGIKKQ
ncbi:unnamed protein product [Cochlearia groenlandica]